MTTENTRPLYGQWRKPTTPGLPRLGLLGSGLLIGAGIVAIAANMFGGWKAVLIWLLFAGPMLLPLLYRDRAGRNGWQKAGTHVAWLTGRQQGQTTFIGGRLGVEAFGTTQLPGLLARTSLHQAEDVHGQPFAMVQIPQAAHYTALLAVEPDGSSLVDPNTIDQWVYQYHLWLSALGREPGLVGAVVVVETAPDPGDLLAAEAARLTRTGAPDLTKHVLHQAASSYPLGSPTITGHVALTYNAKRARGNEKELFAARSDDKPRKRVRSSGEMAALIGARLPGMVRALHGAGAGVPQPMTAAQVIDRVHVAYNPTAKTPGGLDWRQAGPHGARETWGAYHHDSGHSITWEMVEAPRGAVEAQVLEDILGPCDSTVRKRVAMLYRPHDSATAATVADRDVRTAINRATSRKGEPRAHELANLAAARQSAAEEASGAGMVRFATLVTATVTDPDDVAGAADAVDQLARSSKIRLRRCYGSQAAAFTAALGVGIIPAAHIAVPELIREWM